MKLTSCVWNVKMCNVNMYNMKMCNTKCTLFNVKMWDAMQCKFEKYQVAACVCWPATTTHETLLQKLQLWRWWRWWWWIYNKDYDDDDVYQVITMFLSIIVTLIIMALVIFVEFLFVFDLIQVVLKQCFLFVLMM